MGYEDRGETGTQNVPDPDGAYDGPMGRIGGHLGLDVSRVLTAPANVADGWPAGPIIAKAPLHDLGNQGDLVGVDLYDLNVTAIHNEAVMLSEMAGSGYAPELIDINDYGCCLYQEDLGVTEAPQDMEVWRQNLVRMLAAIRARGLRHGDLRGPNIITRGDRSWAVDWQEAHRIGDVAPQKQPWSDSYLLMQHIEGTAGPDGQCDTPRVARRWRAVLGALGATQDFSLPLAGQTFLDLGCFQGDFVALAASEGMRAAGIDRGGFRTGENSIQIGRGLWRGFPYGSIALIEEDIMAPSGGYKADVTVMFSTWAYIVKDYGYHRAVNLLQSIIKDAGVFFFETQLAGDGPGPDFLKTDDDVRTMLHSVGGDGASRVRAIGTFPVTGRPASRTVWEVKW